MESLLLNIMSVAVGAIVGAIGGWFIRGTAAHPDSQPPQPANATDDAEAPENGVENVEAMMSRLHQLTASVAADVDEHNNRVQAINNELTHGGDVVSIVEKLVKVNEQMQSQLLAAEQRLQTQAREIESHVKEARTDALTKLANRRAFDDELRRCVEDYRSGGKPFCMMMIDVDYFKKFNDTYGHLAGDEVLKGVARVLRREMGGNEIVCRFGGEEFAILFPGTELPSVLERAERCRIAVSQEVFEFQGKDLKVTASGGLAQLQQNETGEQLLKRADDSLYVCKEKGRNCGFWHDGDKVHPMKQTVPPRARKKPNVEPDETENVKGHGVFKLAPESSELKLDRRDRIAGLSDRETFCRDLSRRLAEQERTTSPASVLLVTLDRFSEIHDEYGGKPAELALRAAAQILKVTMRDMDHAGRFEDDVFALLLPGVGLADASSIAERMRLAVENCKVPANGRHLRFTVSIGAAETCPGDDQDAVLARAMKALESARESGGNCSLAVSETGEQYPLVLQA